MTRFLTLCVATGLQPLAPGAPFPEAGLLPKEETGVPGILEENPSYDGRGICVAVLDSGIDPGAEGFQQTSDLSPKLVDLVDATGSGDVDTSAIAPIEEGKVKGLSGRLLSLPPSISVPSNEVHLGLKAGWELFPRALVTRLKSERKEDFLKGHRTIQARVRNDETLGQAERAAWLRALADALGEHEDPGPVFDCLVYHDGDRWLALVDTDEDGDLSDEGSLANYRHARQYASFGDQTQLNFTVNIDDDGKRLSLVVPASTHGTHVAGIIGAYYPEQPELNGLAPGAQLVSIKIGDTRLNGMETGSAVLRALQVARARGCHLINMSYGEPTRLPNQGRIIDLTNELVHDHRVVFVASAGNEGPALSTVGAPGATTSSVIGIGAFVTPAMMQAGYALRRTRPDLAYTWSSRGPAADGDRGVSVCAPGGALSAVPNYTLGRNRYANGTSMSSPNACGSLAVLLGALRKEDISYSPASLKRVIENTAQPLPGEDVFSQGHGLLRVDRALAHFRQFRPAPEPRYEVSLPGRDQARGLYLREASDGAKVQSVRVSVRPQFSKLFPNEDKLNFNRRLRLVSTVPWLACPEHLLLTHNKTTFLIDVGPAKVSNTIAVGEIQALDVAHPASGPVFRLPATFIQPPAPTLKWRDAGQLGAGEIKRQFLTTPPGASWVKMTFTNRSAQPGTAVVHLMQTLRQRRHPESGRRFRFEAEPHVPVTRRVAVDSGHTLETAIASYWSNQAPMTYEIALTFHGLTADTDTCLLSPGEPTVRVDVRPLRDHQSLQPSARLSLWQKLIPPHQAEIRTLSNTLDGLTTRGQFHEAQVTYQVSLTDSAEVVPRFPSLNHRLYEADVPSQLYAITDVNGQELAVDDGWNPQPVKLTAGDYRVHYHWRHEDADLLQTLTALPMTLEGRLAAPLSLNIHPTRRDALHRRQTLRKKTLFRRPVCPIHIAGPRPEKLPKLPLDADRLTGNLALHPDAPAPAARLIYTLPPRSTSRTSPPKDLRTLQLDRLRALLASGDAPSFEDELARFRAAFPDALETLLLQLERHDTPAQRKHNHESLLARCDEILSQIDQESLAKHRGRRPLQKANDDPLDRQFEILTDTLYRKCRAIAYHDGQRERSGQPYDPQPFEQAFGQLRQWVDTTQPAYVLAHIRWLRRQKKFGQALNLLNKHMTTAAPTRLLHDKRIKILHRLGWDLWAQHEEQWNRRRFPPQSSSPIASP